VGLGGGRLERYEIIKEARSWLGTKWQHQQAKKGIACDCAGFARGVYGELTGREIEVMDYPATWHLFKKQKRLYEKCKELLIEKQIIDRKPGDILLFAYRDTFVAHHIGIMCSHDTFIHADMDVGKVIESKLDKVWMNRLRYCFKFKEAVD